MRSQRGVTITILVTTVVIMAVIVTAVVYNSLNSVKMNKYYDMYSDIELLDEKIALYYLQNNNNLPVKVNTKTITNLIDDYDLNNVNYNPNNSGNLKEIDLSKLKNITLSDKSATYYIDEKSHTIYSSHGIEVENKVYYTVPLDYQEVNI